MRIDVVATEAEHDGAYLMDCSVCGPLAMAEPAEVDNRCREHLMGHGVTTFFDGEGENNGPPDIRPE